MKSLFNLQKDYINHFFDHVSASDADKLLEMMHSCKGTIIFSGVGKSGFIAHKLAMTYLSTGTKAFYLPPQDALHGDIGMVGKDDLFIAISKSGETDELLRLFPFIRQKGAKIVALVSKENSSFAKKADFTLFLPIPSELCPYNLAPTTSSVVQLIFGNVLGVALMRKKNFSLNDYAKNHPAGAIGKQIALKVKDLMITGDDLPICLPNQTLKEVLPILTEKKCGAVCVCDEEKHLLGVFTDGDLRRTIQAYQNHFFEIEICDLMTVEPKWTEEEVLAYHAMAQMEQKPLVTILPVLKNKKLIGLLRMHDLIQSGLK
ncbi:MAG TPA: KpsF/GutQ family sugar-phosphate isomerase [Chlamydiales bacterium]|nr:KpsF/GutQ family sugar-phosphate isomerase [Chlamydiales bacterium]